MKKIKFPECYCCFMARRYPDDMGPGLCKKQRLPRKKKKQLKKFLSLIGNMQYRSFMSHPTSCEMADEYRLQNPLFHLVPLLTKRRAALDKIGEYCDAAGEGIYFDDKGRLSWYWEYDDDFTGGSSGVMPFCYTKEDAGNTWAFDEVQRLVKWLCHFPEEFTFPREIVSDRTLIEWVHRNFITDVIFHQCESCERYIDYNAMVHAEQSFCKPCYDELSTDPTFFAPPEGEQCEECGWSTTDHAPDCISFFKNTEFS